MSESKTNVTWKAEPIISGGGTSRSATRRAIAVSLFSSGLTFLGALGAVSAKALMSGSGVAMPNGTLLKSPATCPFCGSYNGKQKSDSARLALTAVFFHGAKQASDKGASYVFVSAGSSESCLSKYIGPGKLVNPDVLKAAYPKLYPAPARK